MYIKRAFIALICLFLSGLFCILEGQDVSFRTISVEDGLSNNFVRKIYKDSRGFVWVGTLNGLDRFDGNSLKTYLQPVEQQGEVYDLLETNPDYLWVATTQGLWKLNYDDESFSSIPLPTSNQVFSLMQDAEGQLLIGTADGLCILREEEIRLIPLTDEGKQYTVQIRGIRPGEQQSCWLATDSGLFFCDYSEQGKSTVRYANPLDNNYYSIEKTGPSLFLGTKGSGLLKFDIFSKQFSGNIAVGDKNILFLSGEGDDCLWIGTDGSGLLKLSLSKNEVIERYTYSNPAQYSIASNAVYSFLKDDAMLWVGTYSSGLSYSMHTIFHTYTFKHFSTEKLQVRSFLIEGKKKLIGSRDGFIYIDEQTNTIKTYRTDETTGGLPSNTITSIFRYKGDFLVGTLNGLCVFDTQRLSFKPFREASLFQTGGFYDFTEDEHGNIWMASFNGVLCLSPSGSYTQYTTHNSSLKNNLIHSIERASDGRIWVGSKRGACYYDPASETFKEVGILPEEMNACKITHIYEDRNACIWFCTENNGLYRINKQSTTCDHYTAANGLPDNAITSITEDHLGYFWVATHKGLTRTSFVGNTYITYWKSAGLPGLMFNPGACYYEETTHRLWWGNEDGLVYCDPEEINRNRQAPSVQLTGFYSNGKEVPAAQPPLSKSINRSSEVKLSYFERSFGFSFVALNYLYPNDNVFETKLEGSDKDWQVQERGETSVYYSNLAPGKYLFKVRLSGYPETERSLKVVVRQSWAGLFWLLPSLLLLFVLILFRKDLKRLVKRKKDQTKKTELNPAHYQKDYQSQHKQLLRLMEEKKPYLDPELKMSYLTAELKCTPRELSHIFKEYVQESFTDFINSYRVEAFKGRVRIGESEKYTLLTMSEQCGFNSRASFFRIFKKMTGMTPSEYLKQSGK